MMNQLIGLLLPSIVSLRTYDKIYGEEKCIRTRLERYLKSVLFVNLLSYIITIYIFRVPNFIFTNQFTTKYVILSIAIAIIFPLAEKILKDNIKVGIKVEKNEKKD